VTGHRPVTTINFMWTFIKKYLGWRNWAVLTYNSIFENLFVLFYIGLRTSNYTDTFLIDIFVFILFSIFSTTYGYLINDYADIDLDKEHGKDNTFADDSKPKAIIISFFFLALSVIAGMPFADNQDFALLWLIWILISTFYSLPPIRLKERGKIGLLFVVFAQRLVPILLVFTAFNFPFGWELAILAVYVFFRGASSDINHQLEDYENDLATGTSTYTVSRGKGKVESIMRFSLETEKVLLLIIMLSFIGTLSYLDIIPFMILIGATIIYAGMYFFSLIGIKNKRLGDINPFKPSGSSIYQFLHHSFPSVIFAIFLNLILIYYNWKFVIIFIILGALRGVFSPSMIKNSFIFKLFTKVVKRG
jgi:4-hydroxybenzoate polyprenyltransferase